MSMKFKESPQWYKFFHVATVIAKNCLLWERDQNIDKVAGKDQLSMRIFENN